MQEYKRFTKHVGIVGAAQILTAMRGLILIPVIAKTLGASVYGVYSVLMVTVNFLAPISLIGLDTSLVRFISGEKNKKEIQEGYYSVLVIVFFTSLILSALVFLYAQSLADTIFGDPKATDVIKIGSSLILLFVVDKINLEFFRAVHRMFLFSSLQLLETIGEVGLAALLVLQGYGLDAVIYSFMLLRFILFVVTFIMIAGELKPKVPDFSRIRPYLSLGLPLIPAIFFGWVLSASDRYFIGYFLGAYEVGVYSAAYGIAMTIGLFMTPLLTVLLPTVSKLWEENRISELKNHLSYSLRYFMMLVIPSFFGVSVLSKPFLALMTKPEFATKGYLIIPIVALAVIFYNALYGMYSLIFTLEKKTKIIAKLMILGGLTNIVLNILFIPQFGILAAAISTLISYAVLGILTVITSRKYLKFPVDFKFIVKSIMASSIMAVMLWLLAPAKLMWVVLSIPFGAVIYFVALILLAGFEKKERDFFKSFISSALSRLRSF